MKTAPPEDLTQEQQRKLFEWHCKRYPHSWTYMSGRRRFLRDAIDETLNYWRGEGRKKADWLAVVENRVRQLEKWRGFEPHYPPSSSPPTRDRAYEEKSRPLATVAEVAGQLDLLEG